MIEIDFVDVNNGKTVSSLSAKIMHFRQYEGKTPSQKGGHTVMMFNNQKVIVAKCNHKESFSRRKGVLTCIEKYIERFPLNIGIPKGMNVVDFNSSPDALTVYIGSEPDNKYWWCK